MRGPMMHRRCYLPSFSQGECRIEGPEAHHLSTVLRAAVGDTVELFDGQGNMATATINAVTKKNVIVDIRDVHHTPAAPHQLTLATAVPKGERCDWLVEKATELGVTRWVPLITERSTVDPRDSKLDRLRQTVISACKQSGRNWLMEISPVTPWAQFLANFGPEQRFLVAAPGSDRQFTPAVSRPAALTVAIGPEGGWTDDELDSARQHGAEIVSLGPQILRIETAAIAVAAGWRLITGPSPATQSDR
jgi:16S rRNA (uracil1498-N3)-methyltransferase